MLIHSLDEDDDDVSDDEACDTDCGDEVTAFFH